MQAGIPKAPERTWFTSSYSGAGATECVEAAFVTEGLAVRDSKRPDGDVVTFTAEAWRTFLSDVKGHGGY